jgi:hypothetical protein
VAQDKRAVIEARSRDVDALVLLSEVLNYDFAKKPLDEPFSGCRYRNYSAAACSKSTMPARHCVRIWD